MLYMPLTVYQGFLSCPLVLEPEFGASTIFGLWMLLQQHRSSIIIITALKDCCVTLSLVIILRACVIETFYQSIVINPNSRES